MTFSSPELKSAASAQTAKSSGRTLPSILGGFAKSLGQTVTGATHRAWTNASAVPIWTRIPSAGAPAPRTGAIDTVRWNRQDEAFFARHGRQHCVGAQSAVAAVVPLASEKLGPLQDAGIGQGELDPEDEREAARDVGSPRLMRAFDAVNQRY